MFPVRNTPCQCLRLSGGWGQMVPRTFATLAPIGQMRVQLRNTTCPTALNFSWPRIPQFGEIFFEFASLMTQLPWRSDASRVQAFSICAQRSRRNLYQREQQAEITALQHYYCNKQRQNDKTRRCWKVSLDSRALHDHRTFLIYLSQQDLRKFFIWSRHKKLQC